MHGKHNQKSLNILKILFMMIARSHWVISTCVLNKTFFSAIVVFLCNFTSELEITDSVPWFVLPVCFYKLFADTLAVVSLFDWIYASFSEVWKKKKNTQKLVHWPLFISHFFFFFTTILFISVLSPCSDIFATVSIIYILHLCSLCIVDMQVRTGN